MLDRYIHTFHGFISVTKTPVCERSHKYTKYTEVSVKYYKHFIKEYDESSFTHKKINLQSKRSVYLSLFFMLLSILPFHL